MKQLQDQILRVEAILLAVVDLLVDKGILTRSDIQNKILENAGGQEKE